MNIKDKIFSMRLNEFGFSKVTYLNNDKDDFPYRINVVKYEVCDPPRRVLDADTNSYIMVRESKFVIGTIEWNEHEEEWEFQSCGLRYLKYGTKELNKWIRKFCKKYYIDSGEIKKRGN